MLDSSHSYLAIRPTPGGDRYRQLYLMEKNSQTLLTGGKREVTDILEWTKDNKVYYIATGEEKPGTRYLYMIGRKET